MRMDKINMYKECLLIVLALESQIYKLKNDNKFDLDKEDKLNLSKASNALINTTKNLIYKKKQVNKEIINLNDISVTLLINQNNSVIYGETSHITQEYKQILCQSTTSFDTDLKDPLSDNNPADFSHAKDTLVSSITIVEPNLDTLEDNVKLEDDELKVEYVEDNNFDDDIEQDDEFLDDPIVAKDDLVKTDKDEEVSESKADVPNNRAGMGKCNICGKNITKNNLPTHKKLHSGEKPYSCDICAKSFSRRIDLTRHIKIHGPRKKLECFNCGKKLLNQLSLDRHIKRGMCEKTKLFKTEKKFKCDICSVLFREEENLIKHQETFVHDKYTCETCGKSFYRKKAHERHLKCHSDEKPYSCDLCGISFKSENYDKKHKEMVHGEKPVSCTVCGKVVKHERYLKYHMVTHSEERAYSCEHCGQTFRRPNGLQKHKMYHHSDERPYSCDVCGKAFKDKQTLDKHKNIHNKAEHFRCDICTRSFSFMSALKRHYQRVHKKTK